MQQVIIYGSIAIASAFFLRLFGNKRRQRKIQQLIAAERQLSRLHADRKRKTRATYISTLKLPEIPKSVFDALDSASIEQIHCQIEDGRYNSEQLVAGAISRSIRRGIELNLISDINFEWALTRAQQCDRERYEAKKAGLKLGILHGIPISIKDQIYLKGTSSNWCHSSNLYPLVQEDAMIVKVLKQAGAIPFVKTATPVLPSIDTYSYLWGQAKNPWDTSRSPGGSSGGEGGLIASRCSIVGIGTDSGGSIRIPAAFCGLTGIYTTPQRMPFGKHGGMLGPEGKWPLSPILSTPGPIAKYVGDLQKILQASMNQQVYEISPSTHPQPYDLDIARSRKSLRIGVIIDNSLFQPCVTASRALQMAQKALESNGHKVVEFKLPRPLKSLFQTMFRVWKLDQGRNAAQCLRKQPVQVPQVISALQAAQTSAKAFRKIKQTMKDKGQRAEIAIVEEQEGKEIQFGLIQKKMLTDEMYELMAGREKSQQVREPFDALLLPSMPFPAPPLDIDPCYLLTTAYCAIFNLFGMPAGTVPVTLVTEEESHWKPPGSEPDDRIAKAIKQSLEGARGLPMGVQVASLPYRDEVVIRLMREIEEKVGFDDKPPTILGQ